MKPIPFALALAAAVLSQTAVAAQPLPVAEVFKSPYCGCCTGWVDHMKKAGFEVKVQSVNDVPAARKKLGMPEKLGSCHTTKIGNYVVEGHVPAEDVKRLLAQKPKALGLAVPAMPPGSPGMESPNPVPYDTLLVKADGSTRVFARH